MSKWRARLLFFGGIGISFFAGQLAASQWRGDRLFAESGIENAGQQQEAEDSSENVDPRVVQEWTETLQELRTTGRINQERGAVDWREERRKLRGELGGKESLLPLYRNVRGHISKVRAFGCAQCFRTLCCCPCDWLFPKQDSSPDCVDRRCFSFFKLFCDCGVVLEDFLYNHCGSRNQEDLDGGA